MDVPDEGQVDDVDVYQVYVEYVPEPPEGVAVRIPAVAPLSTDSDVGVIEMDRAVLIVTFVAAGEYAVPPELSTTETQ